MWMGLWGDGRFSPPSTSLYVNGAQAVERPTIDDTYRRFFPMIREKCARMMGDRQEAEDVAQETFLRFWKEGMVRAEPPVATAWIYRTATRLVLDRLRHRQVRERHGAAEPLPVPCLTENVLARSELARLAREVPRAELEAAILHRYDRMGQKEIAEVMGRSERTVRRLLTSFDGRFGAGVKS